MFARAAKAVKKAEDHSLQSACHIKVPLLNGLNHSPALALFGKVLPDLMKPLSEEMKGKGIRMTEHLYSADEGVGRSSPPLLYLTFEKAPKETVPKKKKTVPKQVVPRQGTNPLIPDLPPLLTARNTSTTYYN